MSKKVVAVIFGGQSSEHEISKMSSSTIMSYLSPNKYTIIPIYITKDGRWLIYDGAIENISNSQWEKYSNSVVLSPDRAHKGLLRIVGDKIKNIPVDVVFPVIHGKGGEDGSIQGLLEISGLPYVGCGILSSAVCMDKFYTKKIVNELGIAQARSVAVNKYKLDEHINEDMDNIEKELGYPCFVKPSRAGSSVGVAKAEDRKSLEAALRLASQHDRIILVEEMIFGREVECGVLGNNDAKASVVGEIKAAADFYDFDAKYNNKESKTIVPAELDKEIADKIRENSTAIFKALDCKGISRVDFFVENETNRVVFNEINTMPGFTSISMYPMLWRECGISGEELVDKLIEFALEEKVTD